MSIRRRKAERLPAAESTQEAIDLLARFAELDRELEALAQAADAAIAEVRATRDAAVEPWKAEMKLIFNRLKPWWAVSHADLTDGRRSIELGGCLIGHRTTTPSLKLDGLTEAEAIEHLDALGFDAWAVRTKRELDKPALISALKKLGAAGPDGQLNCDGQDAHVLADLGFRLSQREEFFIARIGPVVAPTETISDQQAGDM